MVSAGGGVQIESGGDLRLTGRGRPEIT